ncbi:MAG: hypothetical protein IKZ49_03650 [Alphaproteobacteria bacterium]|nr:hypothetical protein [Alphaproteobacteria bacterium]
MVPIMSSVAANGTMISSRNEVIGSVFDNRKHNKSFGEDCDWGPDFGGYSDEPLGGGPKRVNLSKQDIAKMIFLLNDPNVVFTRRFYVAEDYLFRVYKNDKAYKRKKEDFSITKTRNGFIIEFPNNSFDVINYNAPTYKTARRLYNILNYTFEHKYMKAALTMKFQEILSKLK